jgi:hypothetical protein
MGIVSGYDYLGAIKMLSAGRYFATLHVGAAIVMIGMAAPAIASPPAGERILDDSGGRIGAYLTRYEALRKSGQRVAIDGTCASACTLLVGVIPHNRICVTPRAVLAFHAAWDPSLMGAQSNAAATKYLWLRYPDDVRRWIRRHGGLGSQTIYLGGRELATMFPTCR